MAAVLTISDTAAACPTDPSLDTTGPTIARALLAPSLGNLFPASSVQRAVVPDEVAAIRAAVERWTASAKEPVRLIITTGGTGMALRDVTVEAIAPLLTKQLPALAQALTAYGLVQTPLAALSNPLAGIVHSAPTAGSGRPERRTLVVCLPGSKGGVKDGLAVLVPLLRHILAVIDPTEAGLAEQASLHGPRVAPAPAQTTETAPVQDACCAHRHPVARHSSAFAHPRPGSTLVPSRQRHSPHVLVTLADALSRVHDVVDSLSGSLGTETRPLGASLQGHVLAEAVCATHDLPAWRSTNVDGYAVVAADGPAGERTVRPKGTRGPLRAGEVERVNTGGPVPDGADAVVMVEDTELVASSPDGSEETTIRLVDGAGSDVVKVGQHLRQPGSDLARGTQVMAAGERVGFGGGEVGVLASVGRRDVAVLRRPTIALLSTGNELVDLDASAGGTGEQAPPVGADGSWTGIYDSNRPALKAVAESMGYQVVDLGVVRDEPGAHEQAMRKGMELADVVITTGGTSMGEGDLVKPLLEHAFGATIHFGRVSMAPGKPTTFASVPFPSSDGQPEATTKLFFALPGNPASALVTFNVFVVPALRGLGGWKRDERELRRISIRLGQPFPRSDRPTYHRCKLTFTPSGLPEAHSTGGQRSSRVASVMGAEVLVLVEASEQGGTVETGEVREGLLLPGGWGA